MKLEANWRQKTLERLEKSDCNDSSYKSHLATRCNALRKIPLEQFTIEDLRLMIGQEIGLNYLIPLALDILSKDLFAEGDFFKGDLLKNVLSVKPVFWIGSQEHWITLARLIKYKRKELADRKLNTDLFDSIRS